MTKALKNHILNCSEMLNEIQERKRCNRLVIIPWRNSKNSKEFQFQFQEFQESIEDHFGVDVNRNGNHFRVGIISGSGSFRGLYISPLRHPCSALIFSLLALNQDYL